MDKYFSSDIVLKVQCYIINQDKFLKEREGVDVTVCCSDGRVLELSNKKIVKFCKIPFYKPSNISVFYAYDPYIKYYIITESSDIIVLKRVLDLKMCTRFSNIQKYEIDDFLKIGKPQVKIWLKDEMEPVVTDFSGSLNSDSPPETHLVVSLNDRLNIMKLCLKEIDNISINKKLCCDKALSNLKSDSKSCSVDSKKIWQKVVDDYWIFCIFMNNISDKLVKNVYFLLEEGLQIETKILKLQDISAKLGHFGFLSSVACVPAHSSAYVVGVLTIPDFNCQKIISKSLSLLYEVDHETESNFEEIKLLSFSLNVVELVNGELGLYKAGKVCIEDIITVMVVDENVMLEVNFKKNTTESELESILVEKLHFIKTKIDILETFCYTVKPKYNSYISRFMLFVDQLSSTSYLFKCYIKNPKHLALFVNILNNSSSSILSVHQNNSIFDNEVPILAAVNKLDEEFKHFSSVLQCAIPSLTQPLKTESELQFTTAMWKDLLENRLQFDTDIKFQAAFGE